MDIGLAHGVNPWTGTAIRESFDTFTISAIVWG
jgi:hypothetical protein